MPGAQADDPDPARHRSAAQRLRRRGGGRCGRRAPVSPRRGDAGERARPGLRRPVHARGRPTCTARPSSSAARTWRPARRSSRPSRRPSSARSGSRSSSTPTARNTTAAAAVLAALAGLRRIARGTLASPVLAATGPVGQRVARLARPAWAPRSPSARASSTAPGQLADQLATASPGARSPRSTLTATDDLGRELQAASQSSSRPGPPECTLLPRRSGRALPELKVLIDLNAVPPLGIEGVEATDKDTDRDRASAPGERSASAAPR